MANWVVSAKKADFGRIAEHFGIDPVIARVMRNRDLISIEEMGEFIGGSMDDMHDAGDLPDINKASEIILDAIKSGCHIRIIGDYDVDGVTSTFILYRGMSSLGANVDYAIPNRVTDGYGINENLIRQAKEDDVALIVTCDNGIAAADSISLARELGIDIVITDHHEVPYVEENDKKQYIYPDALAIVNPKRHDSIYPYKEICGAMVAYKLITYINARLKTSDYILPGGTYIKESTIDELTEMAGFGTVCDVMPLRDENRIVVKKSFELMANSNNVGIRALRRVCELEGKAVNYHQLGFVLGPCVNATGRLDDASLSMELLLSDNMDDAIVKATKLKQLNDYRKDLTEKGVKEAFGIIEKDGIADDKVFVIYLPSVHESLAGIIAGRIREKYYRPVLVLTDSEDCIKGSGRSIENYDMYAELNKVSDLFIKFGGHKMAAGVTLKKDNLGLFRKRLLNNCTLTDSDLIEKICIDVPMPVSYVTEKLIDDLERLEPFGTGNPKPVFADRNLKLLSVKQMGKNGDMARLIAQNSDRQRYELLMFRGFEAFKDSIISEYGEEYIMALLSGGYSDTNIAGLMPIYLDVIYYPGINEFRGKKSIQFIVSDYRFRK